MILLLLKLQLGVFKYRNYPQAYPISLTITFHLQRYL